MQGNQTTADLNPRGPPLYFLRSKLFATTTSLMLLRIERHVENPSISSLRSKVLKAASHSYLVLSIAKPISFSAFRHEST